MARCVTVKIGHAMVVAGGGVGGRGRGVGAAIAEGQGGLRFGILGPVVMTYGGSAVHAGPPRQRALLGYLLLARNTMVTTGELVEAIWGGADPATARTQIQMDVSRIRSTLRQCGAGEALSGGQSGYRLEVEHGALDLDVFAGHVERARALMDAQSHGPAAATLRQGLALWTGPALADAKAAFVEGARSSLTEQWLGAHELLADAQLRAGLHQELVPELTTLVSAHPLREPLVRRLVLALYRCGRQPDALDVAREFRRRLANEHGLDPSRDFAALELTVLRCDPALDRLAEGTSVSPLAAALAQLPAEPGTFSGRVSELAELRAAITTSRPGVPVVVIEGTAGVGKTALALHLAHSVAGQFADGQLYVDLLAHSPGGPLHPADALGTLLRAMGVRPEDVPQDVAAAASVHRGLLAGRRVVLVLDNAASVDQVRPLLPGDHGCAVIVTSRRSLAGLAVHNGAHTMTLPALSPDDARLLVSRLLGPSCVAEAPDAVADLIDLCARLPLALCIAAARIGRGGPAGVARYVARLRQDRLDTLAVPDDDSSAVRSALALSYGAVNASTQKHLRMLALVPGQSVPVEAVAAMAGTSVAAARREMATLAAAHLVDELAEGRYGFHDLLREYARELVAQDTDRDPATARLYSWYVESALGAAASIYPQLVLLPGVGQPSATEARFADARSAMAWLDVEYPNLLAAIHRGTECGQPSATVRLADALRGYLTRRGQLSEWLALADSALGAAVAVGDPVAQASAQLSLATAYRRSSDYRHAIDHLRRAQSLATASGWPAGELAILTNLGVAYYDVGRLARARTIMVQALDLSLSLNRPEHIAMCLSNLGLALCELGHTEHAIRRLLQALDLYDQIASPSAAADARDCLGVAYYNEGRWDHALEQFRQALSTFQELGDELSETLVRAHIATVLAASGRSHEAVEHVQAMDSATLLRSRQIRSESLGAAATVYLGLGDPATAYRLADEAHAVASDVGVVKQQIVALIARAGAARAMGMAQVAKDADAARKLAARHGFARLKDQADSLLAAISVADRVSVGCPPGASGVPAPPTKPAPRRRRAGTPPP